MEGDVFCSERDVGDMPSLRAVLDACWDVEVDGTISGVEGLGLLCDTNVDSRSIVDDSMLMGTARGFDVEGIIGSVVVFWKDRL